MPNLWTYTLHWQIYQAVQALEALNEDIRQKDQKKKEQKLSELLVNAACDNGSTDNISAIVVSFWKIRAGVCSMD